MTTTLDCVAFCLAKYAKQFSENLHLERWQLSDEQVIFSTKALRNFELTSAKSQHGAS